MSSVRLNPVVRPAGKPNGLGAGNTDTIFFQRALEEYRDKNPHDLREFHKLETHIQSSILRFAQNLKAELYNERWGR